MFYSKLNKSSYFDFVLTKDCKLYNREYDDWKLFHIDVTSGLCNEIVTFVPEKEELYETEPSQPTGVTLSNISLTGYDNFLLDVYSGFTTGVTYNIEIDNTFCFHQISGYTQGLLYDIEPGLGYNQLFGGFYQGFFKLYEYPVEFLPPRMRKGWTTNMMIHFPVISTGQTSGTTLNNINTGNIGFIYYLGTRAENKYFDNSLVEIEILKDNYDFTFVDTQSQYTKNYFMLNDLSYEGYYNLKDGIPYSGRTYDFSNPIQLMRENKYIDIINNSFGVRITPDGRIGYRTIYATPCYYTGTTQDVSGITNNSFIDKSDSCDDFTTAKIITKYMTIEESYTRKSVIDVTENKYLLISVVFERDFSYDTLCELKWGEYKNGTLSIYINGFCVYRNKNFTEIIPHELDTDKRFEEGVPFTISFGGGTQGLLDAVLIDPSKPFDSLLEDFFAGTFEGGINFIEMYAIPLDVTEIRKKIITEFGAYNLYYPNGGRRIFIRNKM